MSGNSSENIDQVNIDEKVSEIPLDQEIKNEPKQFSVGLSETIGFKEG